MNVIRFVSENPDVRVGTLALAMGLNLDNEGLARASCALRHAKRYLRLPHAMRVEHGLRDVACKEVGAVHARVKEVTDLSLIAPVEDKEFSPKRHLLRGRNPIPEAELRKMPTWSYIADPRDLSGEQRAAFDASVATHDGKRWAERLIGNLAEAHGVGRVSE